MVADASTFPRFADGDVEIRLTKDPEDVYVLHSYVLTLHSPFMKASLSERWAGQKEGKKIRGIYDLKFDKGKSSSILIRQSDDASVDDATEGGRDDRFELWSGPSSIKLTKDSSREDHDRHAVVYAHKQLLGAFYHVPPSFPSKSFERTKPRLSTLAYFADMYGCSHLVIPPIEKHIYMHMSKGADVFTRNAVDMLRLSMNLKCDWIFREAAINLVKSDRRRFARLQPDLNAIGMSKFIKQKRTDFVRTLQDIEHSLFFLRSRQPDTSPKMDKLATAFFSEMLRKRLGEGFGSGLCEGYEKVYVDMRWSKWYSAQDLRQFMKTFDEDSTELEGGYDLLRSISTAAEDTVKGLFEGWDRWTGGSSAGEYPTFKCIKISDDELPWKARID